MFNLKYDVYVNVLGVYSFRYVGSNVSETIISILRKTYKVPSSLTQQEVIA